MNGNGILQKTTIILGVLLLVLGNIISYGMNISYAEDLELVGKEIGLEVIPTSSRLFDFTNLNPGDTFEAKVTIKNKYVLPFELFLRTQRLGSAPKEDEADLFKQLMLTVYLGDKQIYSGSMMEFAAAEISLGTIDKKESRELRAIVHLPGPETGNEFQKKNVDVKWIFTAQANQPDPEDPKPEDPKEPTLPKTGEIAPMIFYGAGSGLIALGIGVGRKKRK